MNALNEYQRNAVATAARCPDRDFRVAILALGLCGKAGEAGELVKKDAGHGHIIAPSLVAKELGDVLWYLAVLAEEYGFLLSEVADMNTANLSQRYAQGFSTEASVARVDARSAPYGANVVCEYPVASTEP